jgi:hypothetical protein
MGEQGVVLSTLLGFENRGCSENPRVFCEVGEFFGNPGGFENRLRI